jgi:hypothetical protein
MGERKRSTGGTLTVDSNEEQYIIWWLEELSKNGYVLSFERANTFELSHSVLCNKTKILKKSIRQVPAQILSGHNYTPDFKVIWDDSAKGKFISLNMDGPIIGYVEDGKLVSYFEVKPSFDQNNMTRLFKINQKWVYQLYKVYVNLVVPDRLFAKTFIPNRYLFTNKSNKLRKIEMSYRSLNDYVAGDKDRRSNANVLEGL